MPFLSISLVLILHTNWCALSFQLTSTFTLIDMSLRINWYDFQKNTKFGRKSVHLSQKFGRKNVVFLESSAGKVYLCNRNHSISMNYV